MKAFDDKMERFNAKYNLIDTDRISLSHDQTYLDYFGVNILYLYKRLPPPSVADGDKRFDYGIDEGSMCPSNILSTRHYEHFIQEMRK